jgi:ATP-dependent helicase/nuclease subunit B
MSGTPHVFTIAPGLDFAGETVRALLAGTLIDLPFAAEPHRLADLLIYVPTQRLRGILEAEFAAQLAPQPAILPKIRPLADPGDPLDMISARDGADVEGLLPAGATSTRLIGAMERRFMLLPLIEAWRSTLRKGYGDPDELPAAGNPGTSLREQLMLADELGRLIDEMRISGLALSALESTTPPGYDPAQFDIYWAKSRDFLRIAARFWPERLQELGARDDMEAQLDAIDAETRRLEQDPHSPVLVIGSTGSVAATARLMRVAARRRVGAVILPGLDQHLDARGWSAIAADAATLATRYAHPQAALKRLLETIGIQREAVMPIGSAAPDARNRVLGEALRPAETIDAWRVNAAGIDMHAALEGLGVIEAAEEREEALAVAVLMRETLETPDAHVAFVTANRGLARRVRAELRRWKIAVEDSAGIPLAESAAGIFAQLFLHAARTQEGGAILALLRHPLARFGFAQGDIDLLTDALEVLVLRGRFFSAAQSLQARVRHGVENPPFRAHPAAAAFPDRIHGGLATLAKALDDLFGPFLPAAPGMPLGAFAPALTAALRAASADDLGISGLDDDPDAPVLAGLLDDIGRCAGDARVSPEGLAPALDIFMHDVALPPRAGHPRAAILGQLESRLVHADRVIIGGLNEGSFPPAVQEGPFLNRAMRLDLGLQPPERRIGQSAHDFAMLAGNRNLYLTRARREGEQPAMASRFLRRLGAFVGEDGWKLVLARGNAVLDLARQLDAPEHVDALRPPAPVPQGRRVPERLSITEIETLRRDPYAIYARHILKLLPLEPIDPELDNRERGTLLHACLEDYARREPPIDAEQAAAFLREIGTTHFESIRQERELYQFWWQRFLSIIPDFVAFDRARRDAGWRVLTELHGKVALALPSGEAITISGRADRVEIGNDAMLAIFDYKSGAAPTDKAIARGLAPQLPITAALARQGAFRDVAAGGNVSELAHVLIGGTDPLETRMIDPIKAGTATLDALAEDNWRALTDELAAYAAGSLAYVSRKAPRFANREGDYDHLARVREWQAVGRDDVDGAGEDEG